MEFKLIKKDPIENKSEVLVFGMFSNERIKGNLLNADKALGNVLARIFEQEKFTGDIGKSLMINTLGKILAERVLIIGLGKRSKLDPDVLRKMAIVAAKKTIPFSKHIAFSLEKVDRKGYLSALIEGMILGCYEFNKYKTNNKNSNGNIRVDIVTSKFGDKLFKSEYEYGKTIAESTNFTRDMVNEPPLFLTPT